MKNTKFKRMLSIMTIVAVAMTFTLMTTVSVNAAAKKKTVYQVVEQTYDDGTNNIKEKFSYDKKGLLKQVASKSTGEDSSSFKTVYTRNKKGAPKKTKSYEGKKLVWTSNYTVDKKGNVKKVKRYKVENGKKTYDALTKLSYYGNGKVKTHDFSIADGSYKYTIKYKKNGKPYHEVRTDEEFGKKTYDYDKNGHVKKMVRDDNVAVTTTTYKHKLNKKKDIIKTVEVTKFEPKDGGEATTTTMTTTYSIKYDKHGNMTKRVGKSTWQEADGEHKGSFTEKWTYKAFKIEKKYLKYLGD